MNDDKAKEKEKPKRGYLDLLRRIGLVIVILAVTFSVVLLLWRAEGQEMYPAIRDGDLLLASRRNKIWHRGDVVIYQAEGERRVGRIAAVEKDTLGVTESGDLVVNGARQSEEVFYQTVMESEDPILVPEDTVYILGDRRDACRDSRDFGPIPISDLEGKVIGLYRIRGF